MRRLLLLIVKYRAFFLFLGLELVCFTFIVNFNSFQGAAYFNTSNSVAGSTHAMTSSVVEYFELKQGNATLADQNAKLLEEVNSLKRQQRMFDAMKSENQLLQNKISQLTQTDSLKPEKFPFTSINDSAYYAGFDFVAARVIKNDVSKENNYITINKGLAHGVNPGMGVIGPNGVAGKVITASDNYATVKSLLHVNNMTSVELKRSKVLGTLKWDGEEINKGILNYIPRHLPVNEGDTVVTSGFNSLFPKGVMVGTVQEKDLSDASFYRIKVDLTTDFSNLYYVYVVHNRQKEVLDDLEQKTLATENE